MIHMATETGPEKLKLVFISTKHNFSWQISTLQLANLACLGGVRNSFSRVFQIGTIMATNSNVDSYVSISYVENQIWYHKIRESFMESTQVMQCCKVCKLMFLGPLSENKFSAYRNGPMIWVCVPATIMSLRFSLKIGALRCWSKKSQRTAKFYREFSTALSQLRVIFSEETGADLWVTSFLFKCGK